MNNSFPRILTLLRKEHKLSQKQVAADLGVSQALLSHYEKGIRECGLEFLVKVSEYYNVSCDYLLGKTSSRSGGTVIISQNTRKSSKEDPNESAIFNAMRAVFKTCDKFYCEDLKNQLLMLFKLNIYKTFRILYSANSKNSQKMFAVPTNQYSSRTLAAKLICETRLECLSKGENVDFLTGADKNNIPVFVLDEIAKEDEKKAEALFHIISEVEDL